MRRMTTNLGTVVVGTVVLVLVLTSIASADPAPSSTALLADAAGRADAGDHLGAIRLYTRAYDLDADPALLTIIGTEYRKADKPLEAIQNFCAYLLVVPTGPNAEYATEQVRAISASPTACTRAVVNPTFVAPAAAFTTTTPTTTTTAYSRRELAGIATGAAGLVSIGLGLYFGHEARQVSIQLTNHDVTTPWPANVAELDARGQSYSVRETALLVTGGVALATAGVLFVTGRTARRSTERLTIAPSVSHTGGGIAITGGF
jgi:hypothetical protein